MIDIDHEDTFLRTFILFVQAADATMKYANTHFYRKEGISVIKFIVLRALATNGGTMTPSEIAEWTLRERNNITTLVNRLEKDGFVRAERGSSDKRFIHVTLTDKGREILSQAVPVAREIVNQVMSSITEDGAALLENSLRVLRQNAHLGLEHVAKRAQRRQTD